MSKHKPSCDETLATFSHMSVARPVGNLCPAGQLTASRAPTVSERSAVTSELISTLEKCTSLRPTLHHQEINILTFSDEREVCCYTDVNEWGRSKEFHDAKWRCFCWVKGLNETANARTTNRKITLKFMLTHNQHKHSCDCKLTHALPAKPERRMHHKNLDATLSRYATIMVSIHTPTICIPFIGYWSTLWIIWTLRLSLCWMLT